MSTSPTALAANAAVDKASGVSAGRKRSNGAARVWELGEAHQVETERIKPRGLTLVRPCLT